MKEKILMTLGKVGEYNDEKSKSMTTRVTKEGKADVVTKGDLEIGDMIISELLSQDKKVIIESEEHGKQTNIGENGKEDAYITIDDIDGSNNLRIGRGLLPYGSMVVVFEKDDDSKGPYRYKDYKYAACLDYLNRRIYFTEKGLGKVEIYDYDLNLRGNSLDSKQDNSNLALSLSTDLVSSHRGGALGYASNANEQVKDVYFPDELAQVQRKYALVDSASSVIEYAMVGLGVRSGYVSSGKKQHELPLLYAFAKENGLEMTDFDGKSYDDNEYDFHGTNAEVIAASPEVRKDIQDLIAKQRKINKKIERVYSIAMRSKDVQSSGVSKENLGRER